MLNHFYKTEYKKWQKFRCYLYNSKNADVNVLLKTISEVRDTYSSRSDKTLATGNFKHEIKKSAMKPFVKVTLRNR